MPTTHLNMTGATLEVLDKTSYFVVERYDFTPNPKGAMALSGQAGDVDTAKVVATKRYTLEYIDDAIASCRAAGVKSKRLAEWQAIRSKALALGIT